MKNYWLDRKKLTVEEIQIFQDEIKCKWDFQIALGEAIKEKYESQWVKIVDVGPIHAREMK